MVLKPIPWRKPTPAQIDLIERLADADGSIPYARLEYRELLALAELQKLGFADTQAKRRRLEVYLTDSGRELRSNGYLTDKIILRVTGPQIDFLRLLVDSPIDEDIGQPLNGLSGTMYDLCRRMALRGWVEWYDGWNGQRWAKLTDAGREVIVAIGALDRTIINFDEARRHRGLI